MNGHEKEIYSKKLDAVHPPYFLMPAANKPEELHRIKLLGMEIASSLCKHHS